MTAPDEAAALRVRLCEALAIRRDTDWDDVIANARNAGIVRDAEYRAHDRIADENRALRAEAARIEELGRQAIAAEARAVQELEAENAALRAEVERTAWERDLALARVAAVEEVETRMAESLTDSRPWESWSERDRAVRDYEGDLAEALAVEADPAADRRIEAERQRDELRAEVERARTLLEAWEAHSRDDQEWRAQARAKLAAQQPVIDAVVMLDRYRAGESYSQLGVSLAQIKSDLYAATAAYRAALGSAESDAPAESPMHGEHDPCRCGSCMTRAERRAAEADTPAEPAPARTGELERLYAKHREFVDAQMAQYAGEPDDLADLFPSEEQCPLCAAIEAQSRPMRDLAEAIHIDAALPDVIPTGNAVAHCAYLQARKALRSAIQVAAELAPALTGSVDDTEETHHG